ncbi:MAG: hypothetical protein OEV49_04095 [candidate division Zixibacteria bacterium]|nr:hypothetical protein [candidate division Zixibacteria bacterium]MDH3936197.1 hypothetical protein [candidate division Zixibacteria bacterium]MDH4033066.1 hypothetical protein [candidate division Zixibacteria bacterium]
MTLKRASLVLPLMVLTALVGFGCESAPPGQFMADITIGDVDKITRGKIYVQNSRYRMDLSEGGAAWFMTVDQEANLSRSFSPQHKTYVEIAANDQQSIMVDPIQGMRFLRGIGTLRDLGSEEIAGYECQITVVSMQGQPLVTEYLSLDLNFVLKTVNHISEELFLEIDNIELTAVHDSMFAIPEGYNTKSEAGQGPVEVPGWILDVSSVEHTSPPFEQTVAAGELFKVAVEPGYGLDVHGRNVSDGSASFSAVPFILGLPIADVSVYSLNLPNQGTGGGWTFEETPLEADEVVIRVNEGTVAFTIQQIELGFGQTIAAGRQHKQTVAPNQEIVMRLVNIHDGESVCVVKLAKDGALLEGDTVGPLSFRTVSLKTKHASERRTYTVDADEIIVEVQKGQMLINIRQP